MKRKKSIVIAVTVIFLAVACNTIETGEIKKSEIVEVEEVPILDKNTEIKLKDFSFQLVNYYLIESEQDTFKDLNRILEKINYPEADSFELGFDIGFDNTKAEVAKRDAYLVLVVNYNPDGKVKSQRDSVIPKMDIKAVDDQGEDLLLMHNSMKEKYIQFEKPEGFLIFRTYKDIKSVNFHFDQQRYEFIMK